FGLRHFLDRLPLAALGRRRLRAVGVGFGTAAFDQILGVDVRHFDRVTRRTDATGLETMMVENNLRHDASREIESATRCWPGRDYHACCRYLTGATPASSRFPSARTNATNPSWSASANRSTSRRNR